MPRPAAVSLLVLLFALVACQINAPTAQAVQGTERANDTGQSLGGANEPQATPGAFLMGENQDFATPAPVPTINVQATQLFYISAIKTANAESNALRQQLIDANNEGKRIELTTSANRADAARYDAANRASAAQQTQTAVDLQIAIAAQKQADNESAQIEVERIKALQGNNNIIAMCLAAFVIVSVLLSLNLILVRPHVQHVVTHDERVTRPSVPAPHNGPRSTIDRPLPVEPELMYRFMLYATQGKPLGVGSIESSHILKSTERDERTKIITYLDELKHLAHNGGLILTDSAVAYWREWMDWYSPNSVLNVAETAEFTRHDRVNMTENMPMPEVGESASDNFNIIDPADVRDFGANLDAAKNVPDENKDGEQ